VAALEVAVECRAALAPDVLVREQRLQAARRLRVVPGRVEPGEEAVTQDVDRRTAAASSVRSRPRAAATPSR
jgi:hypothetical protein